MYWESHCQEPGLKGNIVYYIAITKINITQQTTLSIKLILNFINHMYTIILLGHGQEKILNSHNFYFKSRTDKKVEC